MVTKLVCGVCSCTVIGKLCNVSAGEQIVFKHFVSSAFYKHFIERSVFS